MSIAAVRVQTETPLILIVEDDADMRFLLRQIMEQEGYRVVEAENGEEGLSSFVDVRPDIILLDGVMPVLDGFKACARLQELPGGEQTPVLMITGLNDNSSVDEAFRSGATDYITKPINRAVLRQRVRRLLRTKQAEEFLWLRDRAIAATSNGIMITDPTRLGNPIIYVNAAFEHLTGFSSEEVQGRNWKFLHGGENDPLPVEEIGLTFTGTDEHPFQTTMQNYRKDGSWFWNELFIFAVRDEAAQQLTNLVYVMHDVTERRQSEEALRESERKYRLVVDNLREVIFQLDVEGRLTFLNPAWTEITGYLVEETLGRSLLDFVYPEDRQRHRELFEPLMQLQKDFFRHEIRFMTKNRSARWFELYAQLTLDADESVIGISGTLNDINERKSAEDALQRANEQLVKQVNELNRRTAEITLLSDMGGFFQACRNAEEAYRVVAQHAHKLFPDDSGALYIIDQSHRLVETVAVWGQTSGKEDWISFGAEECWALRRGRMHVVETNTAGLICKHVQDQNKPGAYICIPMMAQSQALGVLHLRLNEASLRVELDRLSETKKQLASTVAEQIAMALANLKLQETLRNQSTHDALTGLFNRRYLEDVLEREGRRAARSQRNLGIIMLDVDHFKNFNDAYGHDAGDFVLREVSTFMQSNIRVEDIACRYGGEEFTLVLPEISLEWAQQRAESLREGIKHLKLEYRGKSLGNLTVSLGVAIYPQHGLSAEMVLKAADAALYQSKQQGRDRVVIAE